MTGELVPAEFAQHIITGMLMAAVYSAVFYAKKRMKDGEPFNQTKFLATVLVGAGVGASLKLSGVELTSGSVQSTLTAYAGAVALAESILKLLWRSYKRYKRRLTSSTSTTTTETSTSETSS